MHTRLIQKYAPITDKGCNLQTQTNWSQTAMCIVYHIALHAIIEYILGNTIIRM